MDTKAILPLIYFRVHQPNAKVWMAPCSIGNADDSANLVDKSGTTMFNINKSITQYVVNPNHNINLTKKEDWSSNVTNLPSAVPVSFVSSYWFGIVMSVISGVTIALRYEVLHHVHDVSALTFNFWIGIGGTAFCAIGIPLETLALPASTMCILFFVCVVTLQYSFTGPYCLKYMSPPSFSLIRSQYAVMLFFMQLAFHGIFKPGIGNWLEICGAALCIAGCMLSSVCQLFQEIVSKYRPVPKK